MSKIPTTEDFFEHFFSSFPRHGVYLAEEWKKEIINLSKRHTKLHVKAALEAAFENQDIEKHVQEEEYDYPDSSNFRATRQSILNAYPPENIK